MTWIKLDDTFPTHPKVVKAGDDAAWLFVCGLCYCSQHLTDGFIPDGAVGRLTGQSRVERHVRRLIDVRLWEAVEGGYRVCSYDEWQRTRASIESEREAARVRAKSRRSSTEVRAKSRRSSAVEVEVEVEVDRDTPQTPRQSGGLDTCVTCGLPTSSVGESPSCECESNVVAFRAGAVGATE